MFGAKALAVPFHRFSGYFSTMEEGPQAETQHLSNRELQKFASWYRKEAVSEQLNFRLEIDLLEKDLSKGLCFDSDIPLQYGVGSSGAVCAALFDRYASFDASLYPEIQAVTKELKADFAVLESCFHGRSSGLDPLVSYLNQPVLLDDGELKLIDLDLTNLPWAMYLLDTGITSPTSPLVKLFIEKMQNQAFEQFFKQSYLPTNNAIVGAFIRADEKALFDQLNAMCSHQQIHLKEMFPEQVKTQISELLRLGVFIKLLGSGGGGYLLAFCPSEVDLGDQKNSFRIF